MADITKANWTYETAAYLLDRAGFGHNGSVSRTRGEALQIRSMYFADSVTPQKAVDKIMPRRPPRFPTKFETSATRSRQNWLKKMLTANRRRAVQEKMVLFLYGHFATQLSEVGFVPHMDMQIALFREFAAGDFRELCKRININNAMLVFLNGNENKIGLINENYGRELMELYTMGPTDFAGAKNYSQADVAEVARALTGWQDHESISGGPDGFFVPGDQDTGSKLLFAADPVETPNQHPANEHFIPAGGGSGEHADVVDAIFRHRDTEGASSVARFMVRKLWSFFAWAPEVDAGTGRADLTLIDELASIFENGTLDDPRPWILGNVLRAMFVREEFYQRMGDAAANITSPVEFVVRSTRKLAGSLPLSHSENPLSRLLNPLVTMGQELYQPPNVAGWPGDLQWASTQGMLERLEFARELAERDRRSNRQVGMHARKVVRQWLNVENPTRQILLDRLLKFLGPLQVDPATYQAMVDWLGPDDSVIDLSDHETPFVRIRIRGLVHLILSLPQFHRQ